MQVLEKRTCKRKREFMIQMLTLSSINVNMTGDVIQKSELANASLATQGDKHFIYTITL